MKAKRLLSVVRTRMPAVVVATAHRRPLIVTAVNDSSRPLGSIAQENQ